MPRHSGSASSSSATTAVSSSVERPLGSCSRGQLADAAVRPADRPVEARRVEGVVPDPQGVPRRDGHQHRSTGARAARSGSRARRSPATYACRVPLTPGGAPSGHSMSTSASTETGPPVVHGEGSDQGTLLARARGRPGPSPRDACTAPRTPTLTRPRVRVSGRFPLVLFGRDRRCDPARGRAGMPRGRHAAYRPLSPATGQSVTRPFSTSRGMRWLPTNSPCGSTADRIPLSCNQARSS